MTLLATGDNLRNKAMLGLDYMSREEAENEALYQQMRQQEKAQRAQLSGTVAGMGATVAMSNSDKIMGGIKGLMGGGAQSTTGFAGAPILESGSVANAIGASGANTSGIGGSAILESAAVNEALGLGGATAANTGTAGAAILESGSAAAALEGIGGVAGTAATGTAATGAAAGTGAAATGAAATGTAAGSAGSLAAIGTIAAPLAIGLGAFFLLNKLFD
jgi:hypothetical protein